jgi:hypothetical protein
MLVIIVIIAIIAIIRAHWSCSSSSLSSSPSSGHSHRHRHNRRLPLPFTPHTLAHAMFSLDQLGFPQVPHPHSRQEHHEGLDRSHQRSLGLKSLGHCRSQRTTLAGECPVSSKLCALRCTSWEPLLSTCGAVCVSEITKVPPVSPHTLPLPTSILHLHKLISLKLASLRLH